MIKNHRPMTPIQTPAKLPPRFNPFTDGYDLYFTYCRWNGDTSHDHAGLKCGTVYRVVAVEIHSSWTRLTLQEVSTGIILQDDYNSVMFVPLQSYLGYAYAMPEIGERFEMVKVDPVNRTMEKWSTSAVQALERIGTNTWNIITMNSVYTVQLVTR